MGVRRYLASADGTVYILRLDPAFTGAASKTPAPGEAP
jgi:hypothetical protein